jgi:hypothetical protein
MADDFRPVEIEEYPVTHARDQIFLAARHDRGGP